MQATDGADPPVGWAQTAKVPPGWKDPDQVPGFGLKIAAGVFLVFGSLLSVFGNWVISEPADDSGSLARTSQGDALLGFAAFLLLVATTLMVVSIVVRVRSRQAAEKSSRSGSADPSH
jgi:hypothetical protein